MTLDEAIAHAREVAKEKRNDYERACALNVPSEGFCECAAEHEQLAEWLEELKERREAERWISVKERLPEPQKPNDDIYNPNCSDYVLVCIEWWNGQKAIDIACYIFDDEEWEYQGSDESEVIAWKPLPKTPESEAAK